MFIVWKTHIQVESHKIPKCGRCGLSEWRFKAESFTLTEADLKIPLWRNTSKGETRQVQKWSDRRSDRTFFFHSDRMEFGLTEASVRVTAVPHLDTPECNVVICSTHCCPPRLKTNPQYCSSHSESHQIKFLAQKYNWCSLTRSCSESLPPPRNTQNAIKFFITNTGFCKISPWVREDLYFLPGVLWVLSPGILSGVIRYDCCNTVDLFLGVEDNSGWNKLPHCTQVYLSVVPQSLWPKLRSDQIPFGQSEKKNVRSDLRSDHFCTCRVSPLEVFRQSGILSPLRLEWMIPL